MSKGVQTRTTVLDTALNLSSEVGLQGLTFGVLAKRAGLSKSGLYAHFTSKEALQVEVLDTAASRFIDVVLTPALKESRGIPRIERLFELWLRWENEELSGGCIFIAAATEFDDRPGPVRDALIGHLRDLLGMIARSASIAVDEGHFGGDTDTDQFAYEFWAMLQSYLHYSRLLGDDDARMRAHKAFNHLLDRCRIPH